MTYKIYSKYSGHTVASGTTFRHVVIDDSLPMDAQALFIFETSDTQPLKAYLAPNISNYVAKCFSTHLVVPQHATIAINRYLKQRGITVTAGHPISDIVPSQFITLATYYHQHKHSTDPKIQRLCAKLRTHLTKYIRSTAHIFPSSRLIISFGPHTADPLDTIVRLTQRKGPEVWAKPLHQVITQTNLFR